MPLRRSRSFKVTDFGTISKLICPRYGSLLVKFSLATVDLTLTPSLGVIAANFRMIFTSLETTMIVLPDSEDRKIVPSFVWTKHWNMTDGQTDGQTD